MLLYEYNILSQDEKARILWDSGIFLLANRGSNLTFCLYSLFDFYVEVLYNHATNSIVKLQTFKSLQRLTPYLDLINLPFYLFFPLLNPILLLLIL